jgi:hypothetical protein
MKPQGPLATMIVSVATPSRCIALILMAAGHQRIGRRILAHLRKKETQGPPIWDSLSTIREVAHQITAEAHTHSDLRTACFTIVRPIIALMTAHIHRVQEKDGPSVTPHVYNQ